MTSYVERFARQKIKVQGEVVEVLIMGDGAELPIGADLSEEMDRVAAQLAYWAAVVADAKAELMQVEAWYRRYRADFAIKALSGDSKLPDWKIKYQIEASDGFIKHKDAMALAEKHLALAEGMVRGFDKKANQLQSRGAKMRSELNAQGMTTPESPREPRGWNLSGRGSESDDDGVRAPSDGVARPSREEKIRRMEEINGARRKGKARKGKARKEK